MPISLQNILPGLESRYLGFIQAIKTIQLYTSLCLYSCLFSLLIDWKAAFLSNELLRIFLSCSFEELGLDQIKQPKAYIITQVLIYICEIKLTLQENKCQFIKLMNFFHPLNSFVFTPISSCIFRKSFLNHFYFVFFFSSN